MIKVKIKGIERLQKLIDNQVNNLTANVKLLLSKLTDIGFDTAFIEYKTARYDGTNDVKVSIQWVNDNQAKIVAQGQAVAFIEFGTGTTHTEPEHPEAKRLGMNRGEYGLGRGQRFLWIYDGEAGTHGRVSQSRTNPQGEPLVWTTGNPAARAMFKSHINMQEKVNEIFKEVFKWQ